MNPNCYHLHGPSGVQYATEQVKKVLEEKRPKCLIRADIKSYYKSISHHQLVKDIQAHYHDPKLNLMLERIIVNPKHQEVIRIQRQALRYAALYPNFLVAFI